jgi:hypothetical protein
MVTLPSVQSALPLQPAKADPASGIAVSVTTCPEANGALHIAPQSIPAGFDVTVPDPVPVLLIVSVLGGIRLNVAVQLRSADKVRLPSLQSASPVQPAKREPDAGVAVSVTPCPEVNEAPQVAPQLMPAGLDVTAPVPVPAVAIVRVFVGIRLNVAVQLRSAVMVTLPSLQSASPVQPAKRESDAGVAVSVTTCPELNDALQVAPQAMPARLLVSVPLPFPDLLTVSVLVGGFRVNVAVQP